MGLAQLLKLHRGQEGKEQEKEACGSLDTSQVFKTDPICLHPVVPQTPQTQLVHTTAPTSPTEALQRADR